jgi:hypothetical protein
LLGWTGLRSQHASRIAATCAVLSLIAPGTASIGCDPEFTVCVTVRQCSTGEPIQGAHVQFSDSYSGIGYAGDANSAGHYCASDMGSTSPPQQYTIEVEKAGYQDGSFAISDGRSDGDVCLTPLACIPGDTKACACGDGGTGSQVCDAQGNGFGACTCSVPRVAGAE